MVIDRLLITTPKNNIKSAYIWNSLSGIITACESVIITIFLARLYSLDNSGIVSISYAIGNLLATVGKFGIRTFHSTDLETKFNFSSYFCARIISLFVMLCLFIAYILVKHYSLYKTIVISLIFYKFIFDVIEDVIGGELQRKNRLDIAAKMVFFRILLFIIITVSLIMLKINLIKILLVSLLIITVLDVYQIALIKTTFKIDFFTPKAFPFVLLRNSFPYCINAFSFFYITNMSKYVIDTYFNDYLQAIFAFIFYPVFVIELLNNFIYQPTLVNLTKLWLEQQRKKFESKLIRQYLIIFIVTLIILIIAFFLGIKVLSVLFSTDLSLYKKEFMVLLMCGGFLATIGYSSTVLTVMRQSRIVLILSIMFSVVSSFIYQFVVKWNLLGVSLTFLVITIIYSFLCGLEILLKIRRGSL